MLLSEWHTPESLRERQNVTEIQTPERTLAPTLGSSAGLRGARTVHGLCSARVCGGTAAQNGVPPAPSRGRPGSGFQNIPQVQNDDSEIVDPKLGSCAFFLSEAA